MPTFDSNVRQTDDLDKVNRVIVSAFKYDPLFRYFTRQKLNIPPLEPLKDEHFELKDRLRTHLEQGALILEAYNYNVVTVLYPPGIALAPLPWKLSELPQEIRNYFQALENYREKYFANKTFWALSSIGRNFHEEKVDGAISKIIRPVLEECRKSNIPASIEASGELPKEIYLHYGFKIVETHLVGQGKCDANGNSMQDGPGFCTYFMVFEPQKQ